MCMNAQKLAYWNLSSLFSDFGVTIAISTRLITFSADGAFVPAPVNVFVAPTVSKGQVLVRFLNEESDKIVESFFAHFRPKTGTFNSPYQ